MTVALDVRSTLASGTGDRSWTHTPSGTPRGVLVIIADGVATDQVVGVTYGGDALTQVALSPIINTTGEGGSVHGFFRGASVLTGARLVAIDRGDATSYIAACYTVTAADDTEVLDTSTSNSDSDATPDAVLTIGSDSAFVAGGIYSGDNAVTISNPVALAGSQNDVFGDFGTDGALVGSGTTIKTADYTYGWTQTANDATLLVVAIREIPPTTNAPAGHAAGTGAAFGTTMRYAPAGHASGTGAAYQPTIPPTTNAPAGHAAGTGAVPSGGAGGLSVTGTCALGVSHNPYGPAISSDNAYVYVANYTANTVEQVTVSSMTVTGTCDLGANHGPLALAIDSTNAYVYVANYTANTVEQVTVSAGGAKVSPNAGLAAGTGTAYDPPFATTYANAGLAAGTGSAYDPPIRYAPAGLASGVGAAHAPPASVSPNAAVASGTGAAYQPATSLSPNAGVGAGTGAASQPVANLAPNAAVASGTGAAYPTTMQYAVAGLASGSGAALAAVPKVDPNAGLAAGTGDAYQPTIDIGGAPVTYAYAGLASGTGEASGASERVEPSAGVASGAGAAFGASERVEPNAGFASGAGTAYNPPIKYATAGHASGTGAAYAPLVAVSASAGVGAGTGAANAPLVALGPSAGLAAGTGAAADTGKTVAPSAGASAGTGDAYQPTIDTSAGGTFAPAGVAEGTGAAYDPTVTASPSVFAWCDTATGAGTAYRAAIPTISGVTRDEHGWAIPLCTVDAFVSATNAFYGTTTSDGQGRYSIIVAPGVAYFLVAYSVLDVYGVTARDLTA